MKHVIKAVIIDQEDNYLLLTRNNHPTFGNDPDLPGGTLESSESPTEALIREVLEETGIRIPSDQIHHCYTGSEYSKQGTIYSLYRTQLTSQPPVTVSWEHTTYDWLKLDAFLHRVSSANDRYMHMVHDTLIEP